ncbi:OB-fold nucleic acid binding domain-containing protein, partial [Escherichia coli]|uniref:OB-fold nucleic acid binding domain-containing protein n=1 Tax=Escherichia coli TaxID=562 RepID=UPI003F7F15BA
VYSINSLQGDDVWVQLQGTIRPVGMTGQGNGRRYVAMLHDGSGEIELVWFKGIVYVDRMLKPATTYRVYGKINNFKGKLS